MSGPATRVRNRAWSGYAAGVLVGSVVLLTGRVAWGACAAQELAPLSLVLTPAVASAAVASSSALTDMTADCLAHNIAGAVISNGTLQLGVNCEGHLNTPFSPDPLGIGFMGLRYIPTGAASTEPGCQCEGWGVANGAKSGPKVNTCAAGSEQGYANVTVDSGAVNLIVESFLVSADSAVSTVRVNNGADLWRVKHDYHPSAATPNLYEVTVTIENLSGVAKPTLYRRVMDWDIYPTPFNEFVTLNPGLLSPTAKLYRMDNNGFNSANPCSFTSYGTTLEPGDAQAIDLGPADHGALFDFDFGTLAAVGAGAVVTFKTYYGATGDEPSALAAVALVGAENYSFGQPNVGNGDPTHGTPNTFIFAFSGTGTAAVFCGNGTVDPGEQCDDGNTTSCDGCDSNCKVSGCGNGVVCPPEQCDDGNGTNGDGCSSTCQLELCGNGMLNSGEDCDPPGSITCPPGSPAGAFLGCNADCTCPPLPTTTTTTTVTTTTVPGLCGNGLLDPGETCDPPGSITCPPGSPANAFLACNDDCTCPTIPTTTTTVVTTSTTTTTTPVCVPQPENTKAACNNLKDDDCDGQIDCEDPDCANVTPCRPARKDPTSITYGKPGSPDRFRSQATLDMPPTNIVQSRFAVLLTNPAGIVYKAQLGPGNTLPKAAGGTIFRFRDPAARSGRGNPQGIYSIKLKQHRDGSGYTVRAEAYSDLSGATDARMHVQFYIGDNVFITSDAPWTKLTHGWRAPKDH